MFKLLIGAAIGFAAAWFMDSKEGESRRALVKDKATTMAGKAKEQAGGNDGDSYESATSGEPIAETGSASTPGPEAFRQS